ncbi:MAG: hypothetical protein COZ37_01380 [bacterium (Candidatus Ratteibacteria) CG_4_10_14_3_um_filter_41_18]|uniref:Antitoxin n=4 Tax=Candidatus Ratteibacteria TaxID=2979319 RepID=A0A2M7YHY5_9BACT|nr:MAG: hypothetical protein COS11_05145 [bacterium (Candidatus Ratteibacteria) CG01_land_8_20_14_3_00_40_19]PIW31414.1 MAG: hypothetical protein COW28_07300 [bacterium (Candidatus Ratteibacteria) CG15_BIG_FIL_POST_REV_8_21_14_020_41_12]PIX77682.1 MAG: hypothetical protein COZ37_01380 [bacterium (Candidatus Ratteibacteria) CG_4_10_14_3_um_filter_41_18]PJA62565.1 MAG: hypothetical protein CO162_00475 [bacterium (Candidatus Ratteibacteria) CG_4_9_14_3_um_filter_41_21]HCG77384.1 hypothetical prote
MQKTVSAIKVRRNLGELLNRSCYGGDEFIIQRAGKPIAALIPLGEFDTLVELREKSFSALDNIWRKTRGMKLTEKDIEKIIEKVRAEKR